VTAVTKKTFQQEVVEHGQTQIAKKEAERAAASASVEPYIDLSNSKRFRRAVLFNPNNEDHKIKYEHSQIIEKEGYKILSFPTRWRDDEKIDSYFQKTGQYPPGIYVVGGQLPSFDNLKEEPITVDDLLIKKLIFAFDSAKKDLSLSNPRIVIAKAMETLRQLQTLDGNFPKPLTEKSIHGLLGEFINIAHPTIEGCREMLMFQMLPLIGVVLGDAYYLPFGSDKHFPSIFSLGIARTADGKGQAKRACEEAIKLVEPSLRIHSNPSSGEGLVRMLGNLMAMAGGHKKRVAIHSSEMSITFVAQNRKDSTLSGFLRSAYDGESIENFRSENKKSSTADNYILGFAGTITPQELEKCMPLLDWNNGAQNRFLWSIGFKDKNLNRSTSKPDFRQWAEKVKKLVDMNLNTQPTAIDYSPEGARVFDEWCKSLPPHDDTILADSRARAKAQCVRLANLYAQLDERRLNGWKVQIEAHHIEAAIELVQHSWESVEWFLARSTSEAMKVSSADIQKLRMTLVKKVREGGTAELTATEVYEAFPHKNREERDEICVAAGFKPNNGKKTPRGKSPVVWVN
jgi:hypothetical protein